MCENIDRNELACHLIQSVREAFQGLNTWTDKYKRSNKHWTKRLFSKLDCLAVDLGVDIRRGPKRKEEKNLNWEFLYDFYTTIKCEDFVSILERVKKLIAAFEQGDVKDRYLICGIGCRSLRFALVDGKGKVLCRKNY
ncbi:MAG: hypothetical protein F4Z86_05670 [Gemmatimonadetes bacterium]|nr:hypothetical protein [Gemmatimonadota bacterium]MYB59666.1 hypothetical protein [Gemmatimonadota bacterium]MYD61690.1 hypothetical protein [Gemmatimonadota bacterium]